MPVRKNQSEFQNTTFLLVEIQILISFFYPLTWQEIRPLNKASP